jgi:hypothetical protein
MDHSTRFKHPPLPAWPPAARTMAGMIAITGLALLVAACGNSSQRSSAGSSHVGTSATTEAVAFSRCMRSHGVSDFPDPNGSGVWPKRQVQSAAGEPSFQTATQACGHLLPDGGPGVAPSPAVDRQIQADMTKFATCMRSHGVSTWPDPTLDQGRAVFNPSGINTTSPQISSKIHSCERVFPEAIGIPPGA